ncbi:MAG: hypothetical protein IJD55_05160 [Clostridia bacterium]|nr:hypothetical protein [Clostridia bacterium]
MFELVNLVKLYALQLTSWIVKTSTHLIRILIKVTGNSNYIVEGLRTLPKKADGRPSAFNISFLKIKKIIKNLTLLKMCAIIYQASSTTPKGYALLGDFLF